MLDRVMYSHLDPAFSDNVVKYFDSILGLWYDLDDGIDKDRLIMKLLEVLEHANTELEGKLEEIVDNVEMEFKYTFNMVDEIDDLPF